MLFYIYLQKMTKFVGIESHDSFELKGMPVKVYYLFANSSI